MSILNSLKGMIGNEVVSGLASHLGESNDGVNKAMGGILPSLLGGLMNSKQEDHSMLGGLLSQAGGLGGDGIASSLLSGLVGGNSNSGLGSIGSSLVSGLLGNKLGGVADLIGKFAGVKSSSSNSLMSMGGSLIASYLGKKMLGDKLNFGGILNMITGQKDEIAKAAPAGLGSLLGLGNLFDGGTEKVTAAASAVTGAATAATSKVTDTVSSFGNNDDNGKKKGMGWLLPLALIGLLGAGLWWWSNRDKGTEVAPTEEVATIDPTATAEGTATTTTVDATAATATSTVTATDAGATTATATATTTAPAADPNANRASKNVKLSNGTELKAYAGGVEERLVSFLSDPASKLAGDADKSKDWFDFDNLNFDLGKSTITKGSMVQIENLALILKAYPNMKIKVGGYTDKQGNDAANLKLSQSRADAVKAALTSKGANAAQITAAEGYGETLAKVAESASDEARRADRRTAVRIIAK
jgi:outer membrane protein OmpA-like peptidoglycan-associated protein